ncbi:MAG TPA: DUF2252 family protein [Vineibacter sp.]|nr:DUF2252 family protein [Vineibacter sp.]
MTGIVQSTRHYEDWLRQQLGDAFVPADLERKHDKMRRSAFAFLRATYWRWAETVLDLCPDLASAPTVLAVGDIHVENFGTWRDVDGRLVWGVNDFDEAAEMPFLLDIVRLACSVLLARRRRDMPAREICARLLDGYRDGLAAPQPMVLDRDHKWLRKKVIVAEKDRADFWKDLDQQLIDDPVPPPHVLAALRSAFPEPVPLSRIGHRIAGSGSLGRLRLVGIATWRGAALVREAKALAPSAWSRPTGRAAAGLRCHAIATGRYRAPDPWFRVQGAVAVHRLSPNNRKIELDDIDANLLGADMLRAMGHDLAAVHLGTADRREALRDHLRKRGKRRLLDAAETMATAVHGDYVSFRG